MQNLLLPAIRRAHLVTLLLGGLLAACGGTATPTPVPSLTLTPTIPLATLPATAGALIFTPTPTAHQPPPPPPTLVPYTYNAHYQAFEHGFMAYAAEVTCAYVFAYAEEGGYIIIPAAERAKPFGEYHYCTEFATLPTITESPSTPDEPTLPADPFARLWYAYPDMQTALGNPVAPAESYIVTVYPSSQPTGFSGAPWQSPVIGLPDGRTLNCGFRAATAGWCSL